MAQIGIFVGTVYGNALLVAEEAENILKDLATRLRSLKMRRWNPGWITASIRF